MRTYQRVTFGILIAAAIPALAACGQSTSEPSEKWVITNERYDGALAVNTASMIVEGQSVQLEMAAYEDPESSNPPRAVPGGKSGPIMLIQATIDCNDKTLTPNSAKFADELGVITAILPASVVSDEGPMLYGGGDQPYDHAIDQACSADGRAKLTGLKGTDRKGVHGLLQKAAKKAWE